MSMPTPVMIQPIRMAPGDAPRDMSDGKLKTPPPIIEPMTRAMRGRSVNFCDADEALSAVASAVVMMVLPPPKPRITPSRDSVVRNPRTRF